MTFVLALANQLYLTIFSIFHPLFLSLSQKEDKFSLLVLMEYC